MEDFFKFCGLLRISELHTQSKVRWRFHKILWPSQNIWTLQVNCETKKSWKTSFFKDIQLFDAISSWYFFNDVLAFTIKTIKNPIKIAFTKLIEIIQRIIFHQKFTITRPVFTITLKLSKITILSGNYLLPVYLCRM